MPRHRHLVTLTLFLLPLLLGAWLLPSLTRYAVNRTLNNSMDTLIRTYEQRRQILSASIKQMLPRIHYDCGGADIRLLRAPENQNLYVRVMGIMGKDGSRCSSIGQSLFPPLLSQHALADGFHITTTAALFGSRQELVVLHNQGGNMVYWILNSGWLTVALHDDDDLYVFSQHQPSGFTQQRGDEHIMSEPGAQRLRVVNTRDQVVQELWAGSRLSNYWRRQLLLWGTPLLLLTSLGLVWLYRRWLRHHHTLAQRLRRAVIRQEFVPFYQPVVDARQQHIVGYEVLIRWHEHGRNWISPADFIDFAESSQLILPMTEQLLAQVLRDLPRLPADTWISINISAIHVEGPALVQLLEKHHWPAPHRLCFELTERKPIRHLDRALSQLSILRQHGYAFKLDDFGTGYGGFAYLQRLGLQQIKIDKMFVDHLGTQGEQPLLHGIVSFGHQTGMQMIAEGVETQEQVRLLAELGVDLIQGYVFARPMPIAQAAQWQLPSTSDTSRRDNT